jgi:hypothetical protein
MLRQLPRFDIGGSIAPEVTGNRIFPRDLADLREEYIHPAIRRTGDAKTQND